MKVGVTGGGARGRTGQTLAYRDAQQHGVHWLSEGQRLGILPVQRLQRGHQSLAQLLWLEDFKKKMDTESESG